MEKLVRELLLGIGEDPDREGLQEVADARQSSICSGVNFLG